MSGMIAPAPVRPLVWVCRFEWEKRVKKEEVIFLIFTGFGSSPDVHDPSARSSQVGNEINTKKKKTRA
jgi:hypothetical protein